MLELTNPDDYSTSKLQKLGCRFKFAVAKNNKIILPEKSKGVGSIKDAAQDLCRGGEPIILKCATGQDANNFFEFLRQRLFDFGATDDIDRFINDESCQGNLLQFSILPAQTNRELAGYIKFQQAIGGSYDAFCRDYEQEFVFRARVLLSDQEQDVYISDGEGQRSRVLGSRDAVRSKITICLFLPYSVVFINLIYGFLLSRFLTNRYDVETYGDSVGDPAIMEMWSWSPTADQYKPSRMIMHRLVINSPLLLSEFDRGGLYHCD